MKSNCAPFPLFVFLAVAWTGASRAEDWGAYRIVPSSAQQFVLEAAGAGSAEGTAVSIQQPSSAAHQKWQVVPKDDGTVAVSPLHAPRMVLAVKEGGSSRGSAIVLEADGGKPWQRWKLLKQANGSYSLISVHAPGLGLDHFGGKAVSGAAIDLWTYEDGDGHLQWLIQPLEGTGTASLALAPPASAYLAPEIKPEEILPGRIQQFRFAASKIYPGTVRDVTVFIPAQYDAAKPACVYVKTDGFNPGEKANLEKMIATREIPVMVGVFVRPGELPSPVPGTVGRRNRCFEYDGVNDNHVRFLVDELLPYIAKEYQLNLSTDGNDRCMSGGSSGGIAAFTAAWHRPDAFSRVYAASGSWVAFRGGHEFPVMVRKFEAKPIRAFLTTATHDMENAAGDWFLIDQEMDKALKFSGYDYQFRIVEGRHVQGYGDYWPEAMAYLWKGWPERIPAGPGAPRVREIILPGENWELVAEGFKSTRGPSTNERGEVYFADTSSDAIYRIGIDGKVMLFVADCGKAHATSVGPGGEVYTVSEVSGQVLRYSVEAVPDVVMVGLPGHSILARPNGDLYVTSNGPPGQPNAPGTLWLIRDGKKTQVDAGLKFGTGLAYRPDQWLLSVAEGHSKWIYSYQIQEDGTLIHRERFFPLHVADWDDDAGTESICYSREGRQFAATRSGIQITADDGPTQVILPVPGQTRTTGVAIGGATHDTLYAFCGTKIWRRKIQQHVVGAWSPFTKVSPDKL